MSNQTDTENGPIVLEVIKHAAVKSEDGWIFIGKHHADCFHKGFNLSVKMSKKPEDQGFVTSLGRFLGRHEAYNIAMANSQIQERGVKPHKILFSEDLWCPAYEGKYDYDEVKGYVVK